MTVARPRIVLATNAAWNIANFRLGVARGLMEAGFEVVAVAPPDEHVARIEAAGVRFEPLPMNRKGMNPIEDLVLLWRMFRLLRRERPLAYLGYTIKPNVYGGIACRWLGIASIHNVAGLGFAFARESLLSRVARQLYRWGFGAARLVFFQNEEDRGLMLDAKVVDPAITDRLPGSGVDVDRFTPAPAPSGEPAARPFRAVLCARLLREKGIADYAEAARLLKAQGREVEFELLGPFDHDNPSAVAPAEVAAWEAQGLLRHVGGTNDVRPHFAAADVVVLPSYYREGVPRTLLEAASMGRPIVTTDSVGCRETVEDGVTGLLCRPQDPADLAAKIARLMDMPADERERMGLAGRERVRCKFDERIVVQRYVDAVVTILQQRETNQNCRAC
jgi:glycosyltransferase involved in cell wall biosynthesis